MTSIVLPYRRKLELVAAVQWLGQEADASAVLKLCNSTGRVSDNQVLVIDNWPGYIHAQPVDPGFWIIKEQSGKLRLMDDREFNRQYEIHMPFDNLGDPKP